MRREQHNNELQIRGLPKELSCNLLCVVCEAPRPTTVIEQKRHSKYNDRQDSSIVVSAGK